MTKKINEAQVKIDIAGLESGDLETLSRMLALAGQAEQQTSTSPMVPPMAPLDMDSFGDDSAGEVGVTQPIMNPDDAMSAGDISPDMGAGDPLANAVDDLAGSVNDFGADAEMGSMDADPMAMEPEMGEVGIDVEEPGEEVELGLDMGGQPKLESLSSDEDEEVIEEDFDFDRMFSLAGLSMNESVDEVEDEEECEEQIDENRILPDLSLEEDTPAPDTTDFGPFHSEREAVQDGQMKTNGIEGDNFIVVPKGNLYFWRRVVQEDTEASFYDNDGNEHRVHEFKPKAPGTALGDNPLNVNEGDESDDEDDENVEDIFESLQAKYKSFLGDK